MSSGRPAEPSRVPATVLLVDDEPALRRLLAMVLQEEGYRVLQAGDGEEALSVARRHGGGIDLLVTDVAMPRRSGAELAAELTERHSNLQVLFVSGYSDSRLLSRGVDEARVHLLVKPFAPEQLVERVAALLRPV